MYNNRRAHASATIPTDNEARNTNYSLMHQKRRQNLEAQLEEKSQLLKQYSNPRGIGMRGQTVPQKDIDMLQQQIQQINQQLQGLNNPNGAQQPQQQQQVSTPHGSNAIPPSPWGQQQQQQPPSPHGSSAASGVGSGVGRGQPIQPTVTPTTGLGGQTHVGNGGTVVSQPPPNRSQQPNGVFGGGQMQQPMHSGGRTPVSASAVSGARGGMSGAGSTSVGGGQSKREQVWQRKYDLWMQRGGGSKQGSVVGSARPSGVPSLAGQLGSGPVDIFQKPQGGGSNVGSSAPSQGFTPPSVNNQQSNPYARQPLHQQHQQQQQNNEIKYGRRATPPTQGMTPPQQQPAWQQQQQPQAHQQTNRNGHNQQQQQYGQQQQQYGQQQQQQFGNQQQQQFGQRQQQPQSSASSQFGGQSQVSGNAPQHGRRASANSSRPW